MQNLKHSALFSDFETHLNKFCQFCFSFNALLASPCRRVWNQEIKVAEDGIILQEAEGRKKR